MILQNEFAARRQKFLGTLPKQSIAILFAAPEVYRNSDTNYPYRQDSDFYYLTGFKEPEAVAVLIPHREAGEFILFNRPSNPEKEVWTGPYCGQAGATEKFGAHQALSIHDLDSEIQNLLQEKTSLHYPIGQSSKWDLKVQEWIAQAHTKKRGAIVPTQFFNIQSMLHEMRLIKSPAEIECMRKAAKISARAHARAAKMARAGLHEYQLQAELEHEFRMQGTVPAYESIVAAGRNACTLHYVDNDAMIGENDLILIDAACEYEYYASDITRTFPASGQCSPEQQSIHDLVSRTQQAVIDLIKPGLPFEALQAKACHLLTEGLVSLGLLKGKTEDLVEQQAYKPFYMHSLGHWIGLDVHDVGSYQVDGKSRLLEAGMVLTVEPGLYIAENNQNVDAKWRGIGVRIEDDVLVTPAGFEVLSRSA